MKKNLTPILVALGILAAIVFVVFAVMNPGNDSSPEAKTEKTKQPNAAQLAQLKQGQQKGDPNSKVTVIEFGDFQCPACSSVEKELQTGVFPQYGSKINFVFKHFPLVDIHKNAMSSAYAAEAAGVQGKFWQMHDKLYAQQTEWSEVSDPQPKYEAYARDLGLDVTKFKNDMKSKDVKARVEKDKKLAGELGLPGTPTFFVNGKIVEANSTQDITNAIQSALAQ